MASRVNRFARGMRFGTVDAYLSLAIEAAANAESAAGYDILPEQERVRLADLRRQRTRDASAEPSSELL